MKQPNGEFAEVIESSLSKFTGQSWSWNEVPAYGSLVKTNDQNIWGIVYDVKTQPSDPLRVPQAMGLSEQELIKEHPQIFNFLQTNFSAIIVGYSLKPIFYQLSPFTPKIHSFIKKTSIQEEKIFFSDVNYLHLLFENSSIIPNFNELIMAIISRKQDIGLINNQTVGDFIDLISKLYGNDYTKMNILLQRIDNLIEKKNLQISL